MQHCETVKELWDILQHWFSGATKLKKLYSLAEEVHGSSQKGGTIMDYYYDSRVLMRISMMQCPLQMT